MKKLNNLITFFWAAMALGMFAKNEISQLIPNDNTTQTLEKKFEKKSESLASDVLVKDPQLSPKDKFQLNFENAALKNVLDYISQLLSVTFFSDDAIGDEKKAKGVSEVKVTFKSQKSLTQQHVWDFLDLILELGGLARVAMPGQDKSFFRITPITNANKSNLPTFVGTDLNNLPDYKRIRYMYFVQNRQAAHIKDLLAKLQSKNALIEVFQDLNVIIITDNAYNIKGLMKIVKELDNSGLPEVLSILKLKSVDANDVAKLYESLKGREDIFRPFGEPKKGGSRLTENTRVIAEPRTNALIIFGPKESVQKLEDFIINHVDKDLKDQPTRIHVYELNYAPAEQIANILNAVTQFGAESEAAKTGGIRGGEKYLSRMFFEPEKQSNRLIIKGEPEDYKIVKGIIEQLDVQQPQVAIEVFIVTINLNNTKAIQSQIRNNNNCDNKGNFNFQTSGFFNSGIQVDTTNNNGSLVTNLINLATSAFQGSTVLSLGKQSVWALLGILQSTTDTKIIANPFLVATNKYTATVSLGETRRITTGTIFGTGTTTTNNQSEFGETQANLTVSITPQINDFGIVNLDIDVTIDNFIGPITSGDKETRRVHTNANVADQEVLALGGLIRDRESVVESGVPLLKNIPILGFLFKNKQNIIIKENLIIFLSPRIIRPTKELITPYTLNKAERARLTLKSLDDRTNKRDPIHRWFFNEPSDIDNKMVDRFILPAQSGGKITQSEAEQIATISTKIGDTSIKKKRSIANELANKKV